MKKRWIFAALVAIFALAMVGCPDGNKDGATVTGVTITGGGTTVAPGGTLQFGATVAGTGDYVKTVTWSLTGATEAGTTIDQTGKLTVAADEPVGTGKLTVTATSTADTTQSATRIVSVTVTGGGDEGLAITFTAYDGAPPEIIYLEEGQSFTDAGKALPTAAQRPGEWQFAYWESGGAQVTEDSSFILDTTVTGKWWSTTLTDTGDALEKVMLENGSYVIYEFDVSSIGGIDLVDTIEVSYKVSEATTHKGVRNLRLMGPYVHYDYITNIDNGGNDLVAHYGDFAYDNNGAPTARYIAGGGAADYYRDKNAPYINNNFNGANWAGDFAAAFGAGVSITPNEWFTIEYTFNYDLFSGPADGGNGATVGRVNGEANNRVATGADKIYFGLGIPTGGVNDGGIVQLIKGVKIKAIGGSEVVGAIPDFNKDGTGDQAFASYFDPIQYNWRGPANAEVARPEASATPSPLVPNLAGVDLGSSTTAADGTITGHFFVNLEDWQAQTPAGANINDHVPAGTFTGVATKGPLAVTFMENSQRVNLGLLPQNITAMMKASGDLKITIDGSASPGTTNFRYHLGNPFSGSNWNATSGSGDGSFDTRKETTQQFGANKSPLTVAYFILQQRADATENVTINSIKIEYTIIPEVPPSPAATEDLVFFKSTAVGGSDAPVKDGPIDANWYTFTALNAVGPVVFPTDLDITSYKHFTIRVKFYGSDGTTEATVEYGKQWAQVNIGGVDHYNLGEDNPADDQCTIVAPIKPKHEVLKGQNSLALNFQGRSGTTPWGDGTINYVELHEIIFFKD